LPDGKFDIIVSGNVMEHVRDIWIWLDELKRILKKGGVIITIIPTSIDYHPAPYDCWRIYPEGMKTLMVHKNLEILACTFDSLEKKRLPEQIPTVAGYSVMNLDGSLKKSYKLWSVPLRLPLLKKILRPINVAYDTICICRK
jgi:ubiquinone/menaquinone biosynthesis C-methylase UbiE